LSEIPDEFVEEVRPRVQVSRPVAAPRRSSPGYAPIDKGEEIGIRLGQRVRHKKFGDGVVLSCSGQGAHAQVEVNFENGDTKWLVLRYANLDLM
jgi:DNA helicase-2/ATP-dependent DNA helicase PcrA